MKGQEMPEYRFNVFTVAEKIGPLRNYPAPRLAASTEYVGNCITPALAAGDGPGKLELVGGEDRPGDGTAGPTTHPSHANPSGS